MRLSAKGLVYVCVCFGLVVATTRLLGNVVGVDTQNFNTTTSGLDFVTVHSSETLLPGILNFGLFATYGVNTLPFYSQPGESEDSRLGKIRDTLTTGDFNLGLGLLPGWDIGVSFPFVIDQTVASDEARGQFGDRGLTEVRINTKLRFLGDKNGGIATILSVGQNLVDSNPYVGEGGGPSINIEFAGDLTLANFLAMGANLGYRQRNPGSQIEDFPIEPTGNQYIGSFAMSFLLPGIDTKIIFESFASVPVSRGEDTQVDRNQSSAESVLGVKYDATSNWALHFGGGTEMNHSVASPDWRIYAGSNYTFGPLWGQEKQKKVVKKKVKKRRRKKRRRRPKMRQIPPSQATGMGDQAEVAEQPVEPIQPVGPGEEYPSDADETFVLKDIYFAFDSDYRALPGARQLLSGLAKRLEGGFARLVVEGHTDSIGSIGYNIDLGARRAVRVKNFLAKEFGLPRKKIKTITYGENRPIGDNGNFQGRQLNRRVVFRVYYNDGKLPRDGW